MTMNARDVRFFWVEDGSFNDQHNYHWCVDCAWVNVALWHGGHLVSSVAPPADAADTLWVRQKLEKHLHGPAWDRDIAGTSTKQAVGERWLCRACVEFVPRPAAAPIRPEDEPCAKCGCERWFHEYDTPSRMFDRGCAMTWLDAIEDGNGEILQAGLVHCPCDGYAVPRGALGTATSAQAERAS